MNIQSIIEHMNNHHYNEIVALCKKYGKPETFIHNEIQNATLKGVDFEGLDIIYNDNVSLRVNFPQKANETTIKDAIIQLCQATKTHDNSDSKNINDEIDAFKKGFGSIILASMSKDDYPIASYAPLIQLENKLYIYISEVAEHFQSISANPDKIEAFFIEDENKAKSIILRKRLKYKVRARFIERNSTEFETALDHLECSNNQTSAIKTIRQMQDFHLIELQLGLGRFVKGFGEAYDILPNGEIKHVAPSKSKNPHASPHRVQH